MRERPLEFELRTRSDFTEELEGLLLSEGTIRQIALSLLYAHKKELASVILSYLLDVRKDSERWLLTELSRRKTKVNFKFKNLRKFNGVKYGAE